MNAPAPAASGLITTQTSRVGGPHEAAANHGAGLASPYTASGNQTTQATNQLRMLLLSGEIHSGVRLTEQSLVERLGVSRTPVRAALQRIEQEGLLEALPGGGFRPRQYSRSDIWDAIEIHAAVESLAARRAAEHGATPTLIAQARETLLRIDAVLAPAELSVEGYRQYMARNEEFHGLLAAMSGSSMIERQLERSAHHPLVAPINCALIQERMPMVRDELIRAQEQHRHILDAIRRHQSARAESLTQEHARLYARNLMMAIQMRGIPLIHSA